MCWGLETAAEESLSMWELRQNKYTGCRGDEHEGEECCRGRGRGRSATRGSRRGVMALASVGEGDCRLLSGREVVQC